MCPRASLRLAELARKVTANLLSGKLARINRQRSDTLGQSSSLARLFGAIKVR